jgi:hypothetical protein
MTTIYVQFLDSSDAAIVAYFASPQSESEYPNFGTVEATDIPWKEFYDAQDPVTQALLPQPE